MNLDSHIATLTCFQSIGGKTYTKIENRCSELNIDIEDFFKLNENDLINEFSFLKTKFMSSFLKNKNRLYDFVSGEIEFLFNNGIFAVTRNDERYPKKIIKHLKEYAPPILYIGGNFHLLNNETTGVIGSREASSEGLEFTSELIEIFIKNNKTVVSGYARGIDYYAHINTLNNDGKTIFVLSYPFNKFDNKIFKALEKENLVSLDIYENYLIISEFLKYTEISYKSMPIIRNRLIASLSDEIYVIEAGIKSGTVNTALKAKEFGIPVYVADYSKIKINPLGNQFLINEGLNIVEFFSSKKNIL